MGSEWVTEEFGGADLGDERRTERLVELVCALSETPGGALSQACPDTASLRAAMRFFDNPRFEDVAMLQAHLEQTARRMRVLPVVYVPQDTTSVNYSGLRKTKGTGPISHSDNAHGLLLHSSLAITPERVSLGLIHQRIWARPAEKRPEAARRHLPLEQKESVKWIEGLRALNKIAPHCPETTLVSITDREGDLYNMFVEPREKNVELLIRGAHNRTTKTEDAKDQIWSALRKEPIVASMVVTIGKREKQPARQAHLSIQFKKVEIVESKWMRESKEYSTGVDQVSIWVVLAEEKHPPAGRKGVCWLLYSSRPVESAEQATEAVKAYGTRWVIEVWHKTLKSGLNIEAIQADNGVRLARNLSLMSVIGWRIHHIMTRSRGVESGEPCTVCFEEDEWKAAWCRHHGSASPPTEPPRLRDFVRMLCKLSGFIGQKSEGEPGPKRLAKSLDYLTVITETYRIMTKSF